MFGIPTVSAFPLFGYSIGLSPQTLLVGDMNVTIDVESNGDNGPYRMNIFIDDEQVGRFSGTFNLDFWEEDYPGTYRYTWVDRDLKLDLVIEPSHEEPHFVGTKSGKLQPVRR